MSCEDQAVTLMPKHCQLWPCCKDKKKSVLRKNKQGFMICPLCKYSYGKRGK